MSYSTSASRRAAASVVLPFVGPGIVPDGTLNQRDRYISAWSYLPGFPEPGVGECWIINPATRFATFPLYQHPDESLARIVDLSECLASGETISSGSVAQVNGSDLALTNVTINSVAAVPRNVSHTIAIGKAVSFRISGGSEEGGIQSNGRYLLAVTVLTTVPSRSLTVHVPLWIR